MMEEKVVNQYKANFERLKGELKERSKEMDMVKKELEMVKDAKRKVEVMYQSSKNYLADSKMSQNNPNLNKSIRQRRAS